MAVDACKALHNLSVVTRLSRRMIRLCAKQMHHRKMPARRDPTPYRGVVLTVIFVLRQSAGGKLYCRETMGAGTCIFLVMTPLLIRP
jgi:hypothetical protein